MSNRSIYQKSLEDLERMLELMLHLPGYVDDVAKHMIEIANLRNDGAPVTCEYCGIHMYAHNSCTVADVRAQYERKAFELLPSRLVRIR